MRSQNSTNCVAQRIGERIDENGIHSWFEHHSDGTMLACAIAMVIHKAEEKWLKMVLEVPAELKTIRKDGEISSNSDHVMMQAKDAILQKMHSIEEESKSTN